MGLGDWLSVVGIAIAIAQLWRNGRISVATRRLVARIATRISLYNLLLSVPELSRLEAEMESACLQKDVDSCRRLIKEWRELASDTRGMLAKLPLEGIGDLAAEIQTSLTAVLAAKQHLDGSADNLWRNTARMRRSMAKVCQEARTVAATVRVLVDDSSLDKRPAEGGYPRRLWNWLRGEV